MPKTIMVIYNHDDLSHLLEMILTNNGYQARIYPERKQACAELPEVRPDLIIMEPTFGQLQNDQQFIQHLRSNPLCRNTPVILCTVDTTTLTDQNKYFQTMLDNIEVQPFETDRLLASIKNRLDGAWSN